MIRVLGPKIIRREIEIIKKCLLLIDVCNVHVIKYNGARVWERVNVGQEETFVIQARRSMVMEKEMNNVGFHT